MFSHVTVGVRDLNVASSFYDSLLGPLGFRQRQIIPDGGPEARCWVEQSKSLPRFYIYEPYDGNSASAGNGSMVAFLASSEDAVRAAYLGGVDTGGRCCGPPGPRPHYGSGYFGAYLFDPDGNKVHIVCRGDIVTEKD